MYIVLIGDLVASKESGNRQALQAQLAAALEELPQSRSAIVSPYTITLGDEFQAVFAGAQGVFGDIVHILARLHPMRIRFALGLGRIETAINREQAIGMDGPAFHSARTAMNGLKQSSRLFRFDPGTEPGQLFNPVLDLISHNIEGWRDTRLKILDDLFRDVTAKEMARALDISLTAVYKNIAAGDLHSIIQILHTVEQYAQHCLESEV